MLQVQPISAHEYSVASYFLPSKSTSNLQRNEISFAHDFLLSDFLVVAVLGTLVEHIVVENSELVLDLIVLLLHMRNSHGS